MEAIKAKKRRLYKRLPVVVVEDHHEVLRHIYRAIATRHLPFKDITMVHLDAHPDLQIPSKMPAKDVYDLAELSNYLSIENWIIPAVFAGHVNRLVWMKPPWADQLPEGPRQLNIGQHTAHGTIRIDWPDEYYISDVMFATKEEMANPKQLDFNAITINYTVDHRYSKVQTLEEMEQLQKDKKTFIGSELAKQSPSLNDAEKHNSPVTSHASEHHRHEENINQSSGDSKAHADNKGTKRCSSLNDAEGKEPSQRISIPRTGSQRQDESVNDRTLSTTSPDQPGLDEERTSAIRDAIGLGDAFILDIDLDFFSTQNPFQLEYSKEQFAILKDLYHFEAPKNDSIEEIHRVQDRREKQLGDLQEALIWSLKDEKEAGKKLSERWEKVKQFVDDLKAKSKTPLNAELIHMAGETTCDDDDDLPHHVSSQQEIDELMKRVREILLEQPKPTMVTVARSSLDEYCPKDQVDGIQERVVSMLEALYTDIDVKLDYDQPSQKADVQVAS